MNDAPHDHDHIGNTPYELALIYNKQLQEQLRQVNNDLYKCVECLKEIAREDYRGNRPSGAYLAEKTLEHIKQS